LSFFDPMPPGGFVRGGHTVPPPPCMPVLGPAAGFAAADSGLSAGVRVSGLPPASGFNASGTLRGPVELDGFGIAALAASTSIKSGTGCASRVVEVSDDTSRDARFSVNSVASRATGLLSSEGPFVFSQVPAIGAGLADSGMAASGLLHGLADGGLSLSGLFGGLAVLGNSGPSAVCVSGVSAAPLSIRSTLTINFIQRLLRFDSQRRGSHRRVSEASMRIVEALGGR